MCGQVDRWTYMDTYIHICTCGYMDRWVGAWMDEWSDG